MVLPHFTSAQYTRKAAFCVDSAAWANMLCLCHAEEDPEGRQHYLVLPAASPHPKQACRLFARSHLISNAAAASTRNACIIVKPYATL